VTNPPVETTFCFPAWSSHAMRGFSFSNVRMPSLRLPRFPDHRLLMTRKASAHPKRPSWLKYLYIFFSDFCYILTVVIPAIYVMGVTIIFGGFLGWCGWPRKGFLIQPAGEGANWRRRRVSWAGTGAQPSKPLILQD